jgi:bifunctional DNase/RNase
MLKKKDRRTPDRIKIIKILVFVVALAAALYFLVPNLLFLPEISTYGFVRADLVLENRENDGIITLSNGCYQVEIIIDKTQATSIENGINNVINFRPGTHDLMKDMLNGLDIEVIMIKIIEMRNGTYYAKLILRKDNLILSLDSRPSDAIAIAVRTVTPIYVSEDLLKTAGKKLC